MTYQKQRFEARIATEELIEKYFDPAVTLAKCRACPGFASTWSCPDFDFDPLDFWKGFSKFHLIVDRISNEGAASVAAAKDRLFAEKSLYDAEMLALEKERPGSCALAAQECAHCTKCARLAGKPCLHPEQMRYALESLGMLCVNLVKDQFGFDVLWSDGKSVPAYYLLVGGILE
ncbi:DUF2284 domain-containing protein [Emergencia timonensis]|uniref:DUF2284 domain-containing protein n=1 Tax=Emergencia timonensis TaxID=1776384 RepID=UPI0008306CB1|nr:DUF2284 domain-containing protein [Emergencia timonensis]WNX87375.1 DUF2284 domain-containing protein [Emergencia timonensis]